MIDKIINTLEAKHAPNTLDSLSFKIPNELRLCRHAIYSQEIGKNEIPYKEGILKGFGSSSMGM
jgi:hypothetical protein